MEAEVALPYFAVSAGRRMQLLRQPPEISTQGREVQWRREATNKVAKQNEAIMEAAWLMRLEQLKTATVPKKQATFCCDGNCSQGVANVSLWLSSHIHADMMMGACCSCCWLKANHFEVWRRHRWRCHGSECWGRYVKTADLPQG